ncbi:MAG: SUMF1/EgtB/PvdO family nonheme iron enzyme [Planctomycetota bacterium]|jgi:serine/threonine protein kinase|nr:SUMF1/EgtB/PvdO family nonheme iron enzyme [Planctomycetota bacterium]
MAIAGNEELFCKIAIDGNFLTQDQIDECKIIRGRLGRDRPLVIILIEQGYLDDKKLESVLDRVAQEEISSSHRTPPESPGTALFGEIAVQRKKLTQEQLQAALQEQKLRNNQNNPVRLGQILGEHGYLSPADVQDILIRQGKRVVRCRSCKSKFNITSYDANRQYPCRKCGYLLVPLEGSSSIGVVRTLRSSGISTVDEAGTTLIGRILEGFEIVEMVGEGGMAEVYKVFNPNTNEIRALKMMKQSAESVRFGREIRNARLLRHPNIIEIYEDGMLDGKPYFFMEYVDGETLLQRMDRLQVPLPETIDIVTQVALALELAHSHSIIHRDIKPSNLILDSDSEGKTIVKLMDFGIARSVRDQTLTVTGELLGTFKYMSPEHIKGSPSDGRSDIFSLGVLTYELLTGREPFLVDAPVGYLFVNIKEDPLPVYQANRDIPKRLDLLVRKMMAKDPRHRYSVQSLLHDLQIVTSWLSDRGELVETLNSNSAFFVSGGRRLLAGVGAFLGRKTRRITRPNAPQSPPRTIEEPQDEPTFTMKETKETEELEVDQEAQLEFEWATQLEREGNFEGACRSLQALIEVVGPTKHWGLKASQKLQEIQTRIERGETPSSETPPSIWSDDSTVAHISTELLNTNQSATETSTTAPSTSSPPETLDQELAQELLASAKTLASQISSQPENTQLPDELNAIYDRLRNTDWEKEMAEELSEILYVAGHSLIENRSIESGILCYWKLVHQFPDSRRSEAVTRILVQLDCPSGMVYVPPGTTATSSMTKPQDLHAFFIDQHLVSNAEYKVYVDETRCQPPKHWKNRTYALGRAQHPINFLSWEEAMEFARWAGKRLPTEPEWIRAAQGDDQRLWPWGNRFEETYCNCRHAGVMDTTPVDQHSVGASPFGCLDMVGNLWEWTASAHRGRPSHHKVLCGGSWFTYPEFTNVYSRNHDLPNGRTKLYGFRCAKDFSGSTR